VGAAAPKNIAKIRDAKETALKSQAENHPLMQGFMARFPGQDPGRSPAAEENAPPPLWSKRLPEVRRRIGTLRGTTGALPVSSTASLALPPLSENAAKTR